KDGVYVARDYDTFIDAPAIVGIFDLLEFEECGTKFQLANVAPLPDKNDVGLGFEAASLKVNFVNGGSPADRAGLQRGDVLRKADGQPVDSFLQIARL